MVSIKHDGNCCCDSVANMPPVLLLMSSGYSGHISVATNIRCQRVKIKKAKEKGNNIIKGRFFVNIFQGLVGLCK